MSFRAYQTPGSRVPEQPLIGLLLRLAYQHYAQDVDTALREAGLGDR